MDNTCRGTASNRNNMKKTHGLALDDVFRDLYSLSDSGGR